MSANPPSQGGLEHASPEQIVSAQFCGMVLQQANMALMLLGKVPHPDTGERMQNLEGARMFIDQLEMLEVKTKGNLSADESQLLKESLMTLRLGFVESVDAGSAATAKPPSSSPSAPPPPPAQPGPASSGSAEPPTSAPPEEESRKKFSKKY